MEQCLSQESRKKDEFSTIQFFDIILEKTIQTKKNVIQLESLLSKKDYLINSAGILIWDLEKEKKN